MLSNNALKAELLMVPSEEFTPSMIPLMIVSCKGRAKINPFLFLSL